MPASRGMSRQPLGHRLSRAGNTASARSASARAATGAMNKTTDAHARGWRCRPASPLRRQPREQGHDDHRRRQHVRLAARLRLDARPRLGVRLHGPVQPGRLRRRHRGDHEPPGRLRRLRRAADPDQATACNSCVQIPWALVGDVDRLQRPRRARRTAEPRRDRRSRRSTSGKITNWNDPAIKELNPGANLPDLKITPVFRSDGSGTTYNFTDYLSAVSPEWKSKVGNSTAVNLPTGHRRAAARPASPALVSRTDGAIGYVDVAFAINEPHQVRGGPERGREVPLPEPPPDRGGGRGRSRRCRRTTRCTSSTRRSRPRSPTRSRPTPTSSSRSRRRMRPSCGR